MGTPKALHSSAQESWGTPVAVIELARNVLGRIDLDPFSSPEWNEIVGAKRILTKEQDAFACSWGAYNERLTALVNPPGDRRGENVKRAWRLVIENRRNGVVGGGVIWVAFSISQLQTLQGSSRSPLSPEFLRLIPRRRLDYQRVPGVNGGAPPHPSAIVLLPSFGSEGKRQRERFAESGLGEVV